MSVDNLFEIKSKFLSTHIKKSLIVRGKTWKYTFYGSGKETLLFLHGGGCESTDWFRHILFFEKSYQIIAVDFLHANTIEEVLFAIKSILKVHKINKVTVIFASLGSIIAQCFVRKYPEFTKNIILSNFPITERNLKILKFFPFIKYIYPYLTYKLRKNYLKILTQIPQEYQHFYKNEFELQAAKSLNKTQAYSEFSLIRDFFSNYNFSSNDLKEWNGKILIIESENDGTISKSMRERAKGIYPTAKVKTFKDAEHASAITRFDEFNSAILNFLDEDKKIN